MTTHDESDELTGSGGVPARSADRAFDILEYLSRRTQPASSGTIGLECGIPKSSLHNLLKLMKTRRLVTHHPNDKTWSLGPRVSELTPEAPLLVHALAVLRAFSGSAGALTVRDISQRSELPHRVVQRVVPVMQEADLLWVQPDGSYRLGLELFSLAAQVAWVDRLRVQSRPVLTQLRDSTRETANLAVMDGDQAIYVEQVESRQALRYGGWLGRRIPIDGTALGAALRDPGTVHARDGAVEEGVMAIACGIEGTFPPAAVSLLAPSWRIERWGLDSAGRLVAAAARQLTELLT
jgi:IclR family transcriptional regulator, acetate operon repressor